MIENTLWYNPLQFLKDYLEKKENDKNILFFELKEKAKQYSNFEEFYNSLPKLYRWQATDNWLFLNRQNNISSTTWNVFYFTSDKNLAWHFWNYIQEIVFFKSDVITLEESESLIEQAQIEYNNLVKNKIYEGEEFEILETLSLWKYIDIVEILKKPYIMTWNYDNTEYLYYPDYDNSYNELKKLWNDRNS